MIIGQKDNGIKSDLFSYLMLFTDGNRIDLTLLPIDKLEKEFKKDSLTVVLLDKDELFTNLPNPDDRDYLIKSPIDKEFLDCCNEFWWVNTYVAKGLYRNQITYAKRNAGSFCAANVFQNDRMAYWNKHKLFCFVWKSGEVYEGTHCSCNLPEDTFNLS